jgi:hypothetical protein
MIGVNDLLKLAIEGHGGMRRRERISRFRAAASITGAIWALKGKPGLLDRERGRRHRNQRIGGHSNKGIRSDGGGHPGCGPVRGRRVRRARWAGGPRPPRRGNRQDPDGVARGSTPPTVAARTIPKQTSTLRAPWVHSGRTSNGAQPTLPQVRYLMMFAPEGIRTLTF